VGNCLEAKETKDARDKYFLESVYQVDLQAGEPLKKARQVVHLEHAESMPRQHKSLLPTDCIDIKNRADGSPSGFYTIHRPCGEAEIRVYCDMYTGSSYYIVPFPEAVATIDHIRDACSRHGLEPIQLQHTKQIDSLKIMLSTMEMPKDNLYPIAVRVEDIFQSLDLQIDVTEQLQVKNQMAENIAAVSSSELQYVDGTSVEFSGIICSSNYSSLRPPQVKIRLGCTSTIQEYEELKNGTSGSTFQVSCPDGCFDWNNVEVVQGGNDGIYSNTSPICISAIHAGEYNGPGTFKVTLVPALSEYQGFYQNGIVSKSAPGIWGQIGFMVQAIDSCKPPLVNSLTETTRAPKQQSANPNIAQATISKPLMVTTLQTSEIPNVATAEALGTLVGLIGAKSGPVVLDFFRQHANVAMANARELIKEADLERDKTAVSSHVSIRIFQVTFNQLKKGVHALQDKVQSIAATLSYKKDSLLQSIVNLDMQLHRKTTFSNWTMDQIDGDDLYNIFRSNCKGCIGEIQPKWSVSTMAINGNLENAITQDSEITTNNSLDGASLTLSDITFYDFIYSACIFGGTSGALGLTFRVTDENNYYLLQLRQVTGGYKRLVKVVNGEAFEIARIEDGGFIESVWYTVRIESRHSHIAIAIIQGVEPIFETPEPCIDLIDGTHSSGSIGLYTGQIGLAHFARLHVESLPCIRFDQPLAPPLAPQCNLFQLEYILGFNATWRNLYSGTEIWKYAKDIGGEANALVYQSSGGEPEEPVHPSIILLRHVTCTFGTFKVSVFPQCDFGWVGLAIHYKDASHYLLVEASVRQGFRIRQMHGSQVDTLAETSLKKIQISEWNHLQLSLTLDAVTVSHSIGNDNDMDVIFVQAKFQNPVEKHGSVGVASIDCRGCAFTNISLEPANVVDTNLIPQNSDSRPGTLQSPDSKQSFMSTMVTNNACKTLDRRSVCKLINLDIESCLGNFCQVCCQRDTRSQASHAACMQQCRLMDAEIINLQRAVDEAWSGCSKIQPHDFMDCKMCCDSSVVKQTLQIKNLAHHLCKQRCNI
ncbi:bifunctional LCCL domain/Fibrinogen-like, partial [Babesia duncani]